LKVDSARLLVMMRSCFG